MNTFEDMLAGFKREAKEDWIGLWAIVWTLRQTYPKANMAEIQTLALEFVELMLQSGFVVASVSGNAYLQWPDQGFEFVVRRIKNEWNALGREPDLGEIAWFGLPQLN